MVELGQQALLERPKPRSLVVPASCRAWWGVDPSTRGVSIAACYEVFDVDRQEMLVRRFVRSQPFPSLPGAQRLSVIYEETRELALEVAREHMLRPGVIAVEQPSGSGQQVNHELEFAVGVIIAGVYDGAKAGPGGMPPAFELKVGSWWKARSCGNGAARKTKKVPGRSKPVKMGLEEYEVMKWARLNGYRGMSWDEADAMGIAEAMRGELELVGR